MVFKTEKNIELSSQDVQREKRIISRLKLKSLPFSISEENFCSRYIDMFNDLRPLFKYKEGEYAMKWCLSTEKKNESFFINI